LLPVASQRRLTVQARGGTIHSTGAAGAIPVAASGDTDPGTFVVVGVLFVAVGVWFLRSFLLARRYVDVEATVVARR